MPLPQQSVAESIELPVRDLGASLTTAFTQRITCREFTDEALDADDLAGVLAGVLRDSTGWAYPSAHDRRPVTLRALVAFETGPLRTTYLVDALSRTLRRQEPDVREPLSPIAYDDQPWLDVAPLVLSIEADLEPMSQEFSGQDSSGLRGRDFVMLEAGALAQNILLGAAATGLGAVLVGGLRQDACRDLLTTGRHVCSLIAIGHPSRLT